jgi:hypothetical protein
LLYIEASAVFDPSPPICGLVWAQMRSMLTPALSTALTISIPTFAVMLGVLFNRQEILSVRAEVLSLRGEISSLRVETRGEFASVRGEIALLRSDMNREINQLRKDFHADMNQLRDGIHRDMIGLHERVATVEAKQDSQSA